MTIPETASVAFRASVKNIVAHLLLGLLLAMPGFARAESGGQPALLVAGEAAPQGAPDADEVIWNQGLLHYQRGEYDKSLAEFSAYQRRHPDRGAVNNNLGMCLVKLGRPGEALPYLRKAVELEPRDLEARYNLARLLMARGELTGSESEYRAILGLAPTESRAFMELAFIRERRGDHGGALDMLNAVPGASQDAPGEYFYNMGLGAWDGGDIAGAKAAFRLALALEPGDFFSRLASGVVRFQEEDYQGAVRELREAERLRPDDPDVHRYLAQGYEKLGLRGEAAEERAKITGAPAGPSSVEDVKKTLASVGREHGPQEPAETGLIPALDASPRVESAALEPPPADAETTPAAAVNPPDAMAPREEVLRLAAENGELKALVEEYAERKHEWQTSGTEYRDRLKDALVAAAARLLEKGDDREAQAIVEQLFKLQPEDADALFLQGGILLSRGDFVGAREAFERSSRGYRALVGAAPPP